MKLDLCTDMSTKMVVVIQVQVQQLKCSSVSYGNSTQVWVGLADSVPQQLAAKNTCTSG
jgi:hypothetical protein